MLYIRQVRVQAPGTTNQHIIDVKYSGTKTGPLTTVSRGAIVSVVDGGGNVHTYNNDIGTHARVETRPGSTGGKYLTTVADGHETNNLLELPRF
ncbi:hypothetical protein ADILRU_1826 [Leifsonia rubra CMS 76R]|nr:hypothetical protein ADILRU_1826 [Leifsonia rubra CMS 76R]